MYFHMPLARLHMVLTGIRGTGTITRPCSPSTAATPVKPVWLANLATRTIRTRFNAVNGGLSHPCAAVLLLGAVQRRLGQPTAQRGLAMWQPGREPVIAAQVPWFEAISLPGASQMRHARALIESGSYFDRMPDPSLVAPPNGSGPDYVATCRAPDARYALVYFPSGHPATVRTFLLRGPRLAAQWYDPRTGERRDLPLIEIAPWRSTEFRPLWRNKIGFWSCKRA